MTLDIHEIPPAADFQAFLWQRFCESDAMIMLDTASYLDSRWTEAEFGRALAKSIPVLRVGWPGVEQSRRTLIASGSITLEIEELAWQLAAWGH
jgi:hypothetical protein